MIDFIYGTLYKIGFTHPLHPAITHFPMGMVFGGFLFALIAYLLRHQDLTKAASYCFLTALIFVPPTVVLGYMDWQFKFEGEWNYIIRNKMVLAAVLFILLCISVFTGGKEKVVTTRKLLIYFLCALTCVGLGFMGGELQYG